MCSWFFWLSKIRLPVSSARQSLPPEFPQSFGVDSGADSAFAYQHLQPVWSCGCGREATGLRFWGTAGAGHEVDSVSLQKLQCSYQTALCFGLSKECTVQIAENRELGASMLHKTEVKTCTNVRSTSPKDSIYSIHTAWSCF